MMHTRTIAPNLGLVPNGKRSVIPVPAHILAKVPKPTGKNENIKSHGADPVRDTVPLIQKLAKRQAWQGKKLAEYLKGKTVAETVRNNWNFFMRYIQYRKDPADSEQVRSLRRLVHNAAEGGDCDCFVNALSVLLLNQGIDFKLRVAKYNGSDNYSHIYIVVPTGNGKYITLDPVIHEFNSEAPYTYYKDFDMKLESLDGYSSPAAMDGLGCACGCDTKKGADKNSVPKKRVFVPTKQLNYAGYDTTARVLAKSGIQSVTSGKNVVAVTPNGNVQVPSVVPFNSEAQLVQQVQQRAAEASAATAESNQKTLMASMPESVKTPAKILGGILLGSVLLSFIRPSQAA